MRKINGYAHELLDLLMRWNRGEEEALQVLESQVRKIRIKGIEEDVKHYRFKDPRELALKAMATIQDQLEFQMSILEKLFDVKQVQIFQNEIIELLGDVDPGMRKEFMRRLQEKCALRRAVRF